MCVISHNDIFKYRLYKVIFKYRLRKVIFF